MLAGGFVLGEFMNLLGKAALEGLAAAMAAALLCCFFNGERIENYRKFLAGGRPWIWLLPVCVCVGFGRAQLEKNVCSKELLRFTETEWAEASGTVLSVQESDDFRLVMLEKPQLWTKAKERSRLRRLQIWISDDSRFEEERLQVGNQIRVRGRLSSLERARNPGQFDARLYGFSKKLTWSMWAEEVVLTDRSFRPYREALGRFSSWGARQLEEAAGPDAGVLQAVLLGDRGQLSDEVRALYQEAGIAHLLAVSGMHLSLLGAVAYGLLRKAGVGYGISGVVGGLALGSYALLTGGSSSVMRALIMTLCGFLAAFWGRTYDLLTAAGLAAVWLFFDSPYQLTQAGSVLSFGAVFGVGAALAWTGGRRKKQAEPLSSALQAGAGIQLATLPLMLYHYFQIPLYGILLNLLVVPLAGILAGSGAAGMLLSDISPFLGRFAAGGARAVLWWYAWCCRQFLHLPGSILVLGRPRSWQIGLYYGILFSVYFRKTEQLHHGIRSRKPRCSLFFAAAMFSLMPLPVRGMEAAFLDAGQGDGICIRSGCEAVMIDGGSSDEKHLGERVLKPYLHSQGIHRLKLWIVSHGDQDHISGLKSIIQEETVAIGTLALPQAGQADPACQELAALAEGRGIKIWWMKRGDRAKLGAIWLRCLYPCKTDDETPTMYGREPEDRNAESLVVEVGVGDTSVLLTGDMGKEQEQELKAIEEASGGWSGAGRCILKVAHHGSRFSSDPAWIDMIGADWAVISYGEGNSYGHPHEEVRQLFRERGIFVYETGGNGAVILKSDGGKVWQKRWQSP